jgi:hypothetical protein
MEAPMKRILMAIWIPVLFLSVTHADSMAASLDQLKNIIIDMQKPAVEFQCANFKVNPGPDSGSYAWTLDLSINQSISKNTYIVKTVFQNKAGLNGDNHIIFVKQELKMTQNNLFGIVPLHV